MTVDEEEIRANQSKVGLDSLWQMNSSKQDAIAETAPIYMYIHTYVCMYICFYIIYSIYISVYIDTLMYKCVFIYIKSKLCVFPATVNIVIVQIVNDRALPSLFQMKNISSYF